MAKTLGVAKFRIETDDAQNAIKENYSHSDKNF